MKETAVSLLAETTTEGWRAPREALWMDRNADSFLRGTLGVPDCTPDPIRHAAASTGASTSKGGGYKADRAKEAEGQTWIGMCEERGAWERGGGTDVSLCVKCICQHSARLHPRLAGRSVSQGVKGGRRSSAWVQASVCQ